MGRKPRSGGAAENRITVRLTDRELATARAMVDGNDVSALVRRLLEEERARTDFVDVPFVGPCRFNTGLGGLPAFVFTLHAVPGRHGPLCVRRRVVNVDGEFLRFPLAGGRPIVSFYDLQDHGGQPTRGEVDERDKRDRVQPVVMVFATLPDEQERARWRIWRRGYERAVGTKHAWIVADGLAARVELRHPGYRERTTRLFHWGGRQHEVDVLRIGERPTYASYRRSVGFTGGSEYFQDVTLFRVWLDEPDDDAIAIETRRQAELEDEERRRKAKARRRASGLPETMFNALDRLDLEWPCDEGEVRRAQRRAALKHHPDRGGSTEAMRAVNAAAALILEWLRRTGYAA